MNDEPENEPVEPSLAYRLALYIVLILIVIASAAVVAWLLAH